MTEENNNKGLNDEKQNVQNDQQSQSYEDSQTKKEIISENKNEESADSNPGNETPDSSDKEIKENSETIDKDLPISEDNTLKNEESPNPDDTSFMAKKSEKTNSKTTDPLANFNWDEIGKKDSTYSNKERTELEKLYDKTLSVVQQGEVVSGTIVAMNKREVVVNIGYKSEGIINANEFRYEPDIKVGDEVEVFVENIDSGDGQLLISHNKAKSLKAWDRVNEAFERNEIIKGYIKCRTKGGMIVDVFGIEAFLPGSQIDVKPIRDYDVFVDKTMDFKIVKINEEFKNVVVSHKALIEAELEEQKKEIIARLEKGQVLEGVVKNITSYGVFIDLGGVDGLIHITDLSWGRVNHPEEIVKLDEKINVVILDFDDEKKRIALGYKQLKPHPWESLDENIKVGDKVKGKVVVLADYGAFIEIKPGVEGLIHVSEMSWSQHLRSAQDFMKIDDEVEAIILTLDREERKMSLGIKQLFPDPWKDIEKRYSLNSKHTAKVRNFTNFGVFVELEEGVDGLVHISDLSWTKKIKHPAEFTSIDADLEVVVLEIDEENRRLSLGHKQIEENPWEVFETIFSNDSIHEGTITEVNEKGSIISLPYGVEGFATPKHLVKKDGNKAKIDEKLNFKVIEFNKDAKKIFVSHSRIHEDEERAKEQSKDKKSTSKSGKKTKNIADKMEKTTIGDITDLAALKKEIEDKEKKMKEEKKKKLESEVKQSEKQIDQEKNKPVDDNKDDDVVNQTDTTSDTQEEVITDDKKTKEKKSKKTTSKTKVADEEKVEKTETKKKATSRKKTTTKDKVKDDASKKESEDKKSTTKKKKEEDVEVNKTKTKKTKTTAKKKDSDSEED